MANSTSITVIYPTWVAASVLEYWVHWVGSCCEVVELHSCWWLMVVVGHVVVVGYTSWVYILVHLLLVVVVFVLVSTELDELHVVRWQLYMFLLVVVTPVFSSTSISAWKARMSGEHLIFAELQGGHLQLIVHSVDERSNKSLVRDYASALTEDISWQKEHTCLWLYTRGSSEPADSSQHEKSSTQCHSHYQQQQQHSILTASVVVCTVILCSDQCMMYYVT